MDLRDNSYFTMRARKNQVWLWAGSIVCLVAILGTLGGHWMVLQSFAWARMILDNSRHQSLGIAIVMTFDGKHPCGLCLAIDQGKSTEKKSDQQKPAGKIEGLIVAHHWALCGAAEFPSVIPLPLALHDWQEPPPLPPPRTA